METLLEELSSHEFYAKRIEIILNDQYSYAPYFVHLKDDYTIKDNPEEILQNFFIPYIISCILLEGITDYDLNSIEKEFQKNKRIFPIEFLLDNLNTLEYSFQNYLEDVNKDFQEIDEDDLIDYAFYIQESASFNDFINELSQKAYTLLKNNLSIQNAISQILSSIEN